MDDQKPYMGLCDFDQTQLHHSSRKVSDYAYRVLLFNGKIFENEIVFDETRVGSESAPVPLLIQNIGLKSLTIKEIICVGDFSIKNEIETPKTLKKNELLQINVVFSPLRSGESTGGIYIDTGDSMGDEFTKLVGTANNTDPNFITLSGEILYIE